MALRSALRDTDQRILEASHMTATVSTERGFHYTVVSRPGFVIVIDDDSGLVHKGNKLTVVDGCMYLWKGTYIFHSSPITACYILSKM